MNLLQHYLKRSFVFLSLAVVSFSCAQENIIKRGDTLPVAFKKAMGLYAEENYSDAAEAFETVISIGRGTEYGQEAQFYLAEAYFNNGRYLMAASEYERFTSLYPRAPKRQEADFKEAYSYFKLSPRYRLDQSYTHTAIEKFRLYNSRYPNSDRVDEAAKYIDKLRSKLAHELYGAADLYMRTDQYEAAIIYYGLVIDQYPETAWAEQALVNQINAYVVYADNSVRNSQRKRYRKAVESYETYIQLFPQGEHRSRAEDLVDEARTALAGLRDNPQDNKDTTASSTNR